MAPTGVYELRLQLATHGHFCRLSHCTRPKMFARTTWAKLQNIASCFEASHGPWKEGSSGQLTYKKNKVGSTYQSRSSMKSIGLESCGSFHHDPAQKEKFIRE